jgi:hypothetical protein
MKPTIRFIFFILLFSCKKEDPEKEGPCGVKKPLEELSWLKQEIELLSTSPDLGYAYFTKNYKGERVFWPSRSISSSSSVYYTCDGKQHNISSPIPEDKETQVFFKLLLSSKDSCPYLIWSTPYFQKLINCP